MTQDELKELFVYERRGMLRKVKNCRKPYPWRKAGKDGRYLITTLPGGKTEYLHRLVFLYHKGYLPDEIDHKDRDTTNNRIGNLRPCTDAQNQYNGPRKVNNRSGYKGVVEHKKCTRKKWQAKITVNKKIISLGYFEAPEQAHKAYVAASKKYAKEFAHPG